MKNIIRFQTSESSIASQRVAHREPVIIAGDFNMTVQNPIFQKYWSRFTDSFERRGWGLGATEFFTRWYGVRIDHILCGPRWRVLSSEVGPDIHGDHRPVFARLALIRPVKGINIMPKAKRPVVLPPANRILFYDNFRVSSGHFSGNDDTDVEPADLAVVGSVLSITQHAGEGLAMAVAKTESWELTSFPVVSFSYRIPPGMPVAVRVQTQFGDTICLGATAGTSCPGSQVRNPFHLIADNKWHQARVDVRAAVHSLLPGVHWLQDWEFVVPGQESIGESFWIDDFLISDPSDK